MEDIETPLVKDFLLNCVQKVQKDTFETLADYDEKEDDPKLIQLDWIQR